MFSYCCIASVMEHDIMLIIIDVRGVLCIIHVSQSSLEFIPPGP